MSKEKELFKAGTESGFIFNLGSNKTPFNLDTGKMTLEGANVTYHDEEGNEITKEQFNELRIKKLEETISNLEVTVSSLTGCVKHLQIENSDLSNQIDLKVSADNVISAINTSQESIRIKGNKIHIDGKTLIEDSVLKDKELSISLDNENYPKVTLYKDGNANAKDFISR